MALKQLIAASIDLENRRQRIEELKAERQKHNDRLAEIVTELAAARAGSDAAIATIKTEAATVTSP